MKKRKGRKSKKLLKFLSLFFIIAIIAISFKFFYDKSREIKIISPIAFFNSGSKIQELESKLAKSNISFDSLSVSDSAYLMKFKTGEVVIFDSNKEVDKQISSLQLILSRLTIEGKRLVRLDLRYDKPVIQFQE